MGRYVKLYSDVSVATQATDIISPNVSYISELPWGGGEGKLLLADIGDNKELKIEVDGKGDVIIRKVRDYLTFTCIEAGGISLSDYGDSPNIEYSKNGSEWATWDYTNIDLKAGDIVKMKGDNPNGFNTSVDTCAAFVITTGKFAASGNVMSLIDGQKDGTKVIPCDYCFVALFWRCDALTSAPELPATTLASYCYYGMFANCTSLTSAPELPATTLASNCYYIMFEGCSSLTAAPELPATTLLNNCYEGMFNNCSSLNYIKCLATDLSAYKCTTNWVNCVSGFGEFIRDENTIWEISENGIPEGWTITPQMPIIIHYDSEHGTPPEDKTVNIPYTLTSADLPELEEEGYTFLGWDYSVGDVIKKNTTITAEWKQTRCLIEYDSEFGDTPESKTVNNPYTLTAADLPELSEPGYTFDGWDYSVGDVIEEDTLITASWTKSSCEITYDSEYGFPPEDKTVDVGYELTDEDLPEIGEEGYAFLGRNKSVGDIINEDTTITARWKQTGWWIWYDSEYGTPPYDKLVGVPYTLKASDLPELSEPGYKFVGWDYSVGDIIEDETTITAEWEEEE